MIHELAYNLTGLTIPLLALIVFVIPLIEKLTGSRRATYLLALTGSMLAAFSSVIILIAVYWEGEPLLYPFGGWPPHYGIVYEVDGLNALIGAYTALTMLAVTLYSVWYGRHLDEPVWYYVLLLGLEIGMLGCLYTGDAFNLFVMLEVLSISAYGLVSYHKGRAEAVEAAAKYALIGAVATNMYFGALVILYVTHGSLNMGLLSAISQYYRFAGEGVKYAGLIVVAFSLWVFTYKSALFPNHFWLPDAHPEAPTPVSAALSGMVVNVGVYAVMRFMYTLFGPSSYLAGYREAVLVALFILGSVSGVVGALLMMSQRDVKRLLAYSTISHIGIIYIGLSAGFLTGTGEAVKIAVAGAVTHIVSHGLAKSMLFMASGVFIDAAGSRDMDEMRGVGRLYPLASFAWVAGFLSLAGLLPFLGFYSKLLIYYGYAYSGFILGGIMIIVISALSLPGYFKAIYSVVFSVGREHRRVNARSVEWMLFTIAMVLLVLGALFPLIEGVFMNASASITTVDGVNRYYLVVSREIARILGGGYP
ncbi:proton-conducting transporter membrane subunit [Desulfurococcus mucosus]|uniref:Membrane bound hydrogenase subunit mbhH n=2 Tax=Desulfurococcus mucosus TaxID=2275 RepID=E8R9D6_DESM0|nr:proton-conducting transporter membrane subunit [Desulfurococcus mucosus]ADV65112.1 Membrane bound hydrogenase subunit mbhH [Desulfurococcus mucosus DSM 2162]